MSMLEGSEEAENVQDSIGEDVGKTADTHAGAYYDYPVPKGDTVYTELG